MCKEHTHHESELCADNWREEEEALNKEIFSAQEMCTWAMPSKTSEALAAVGRQLRGWAGSCLCVLQGFWLSLQGSEQGFRSQGWCLCRINI